MNEIIHYLFYLLCLIANIAIVFTVFYMLINWLLYQTDIPFWVDYWRTNGGA